MSRRIAVADIGGTHARFALAEIASGKVAALGDPVTLRTSDYASFQTAWQHFKTGAEADVDSLAIAFAGPVDGDVLRLTNNPWVIRPALAREKLDVENFVIVNDFGAIAHAVARLGEESFLHLAGPAGPLPDQGVVSIIGPGTGLGVAQLLRLPAEPGGYHVLETEGGHVDFAPLDPIEDKLLAILRRTLRRVSAERIVSGPGLRNIHSALGAIEGKAVAAIEDRELWELAMSGTDPLAAAALDHFFLSFGSVAGDLALAHGAAAVVIAGGLGYRLRDHFARSGFADRFIAKGRFERRMQALPVKLIIHPQPGLFGAAAAFARKYG